MSAPVSAAAYNQARRLYDDFAAKVRAHIHLPTELNHFVIKPSQMADILHQQHVDQLAVLEMARGPLRDANGIVVGLSVNGDGTPISLAQFEAETAALYAHQVQQFDRLQADVTATHASMRALAVDHGTTAADLYAELNKQGGVRC